MHEHIKVLVVEDNPADRLLLQRRLAEYAELDLRFTATLSEALAALDQQRVDLILTDLRLPDSVGADTVRALVEKAEDVPVVVLTGMTDLDLVVSVVQAGADRVVSKEDWNGNLRVALTEAYQARRQQESHVTELCAAVDRLFDAAERRVRECQRQVALTHS